MCIIYSCSNKQNDSKDSIIAGELGLKLDTTLTPYLQKIVKDYDLPGIGIGIVQNDTIVYAKTLGYLNKETKEPALLTSLFHMASVSKPFVATAIMQLVEQERIHLDSTVVSYLPYFELAGGAYETITIRQMLCHISGMPDVQDYGWSEPEYDEGALEQYVRSISHHSMLSAPGEKFAYSNMAFECLGDVIAKVSEMPFAEYVKHFILNPAGMQASTFLKPDDLPENWASPHTQIVSTELENVYPYNRMHGPSSTLHSNVIEMCNWAIINLNRGTHKGQTILKSESYEALWNPLFQTGQNDYVGLSWFLRSFREYSTVGHSGGDTGFKTDFIMLPENDIAVVVLCNLNPSPVTNIKFTALDIILGHEPHHAPSPASIPVSKALEENGLESAVALWDSLKANHVDEYDFHPQHFVGLFIAMDLGRVEESTSLAQLCVRIFPNSVIENIMRTIQGYYTSHPENMAAPAILDILQVQ